MSFEKQNVKLNLGDGACGVRIDTEGRQFTCIANNCRALLLCLYDRNHKKLLQVDMKQYHVSGSVYSVQICGVELQDTLYRFYKDGELYFDGYERDIWPRRAFGEPAYDCKDIYLSVPTNRTKPASYPKLPLSEVVIYQLHVRGFSMHQSSKVEHPGTFLGVVDKLPYLKRLGVNQLMLMPVYDFEERSEQSNSINYWGFCKSRYFVPKSGYAVKDPASEFMYMVDRLHGNHMEVVMQFCFEKKCSPYYIGECLRYWHLHYGVDGFLLIGENVPSNYLRTLPALYDAKLYFEQGEGHCSSELIQGNTNTAFLSSDYMRVIRKFLKSDADMLQDFAYALRNHPEDHVINYISNFNEFTLRDMVTYEFKHNEDNGEYNRDGNGCNYTWNCGCEGETSKSAVRKLRKKQMQNAASMLLLSQGIPMILAGDEWGQSRGGNNNPYCQDNEISWLNWDYDASGKNLLSFFRKLLIIRKEYPILHNANPIRMMDYKAIGYPDLSYHGTNAWYPQFMENIRHIGMLYCEKYAEGAKISGSGFVYLAFNMHWEDRELALPPLPKGKKWKCVLKTDIMPKDLDGKDAFLLKGRSVCILMSE